ncbi:MAG: hypothetical protein JWN66_2471 [Sphingomonas bacterium]|uniref:DUF3617 domain-containing protein n=1 Tax=Sphingomonas bacterium TaxID=1895847 RepID=UPI002615D794|nr:DUF3617 family protein [Sphingomonas bacterium]MDB5705355.1 hypothetical protein [Sphingomonas bacterium]
MLKLTLVAAATSALLLSGCGQSASPATKRQPGSWTQKIDVVRLDGKSAADKAALQRTFDTYSFMSICLTPEAAAKEDVTADLGNVGGSGTSCIFDKRSVSGDAIETSGICGAGTTKARMSVKGTSGTTAQDLMVTIEPVDKNIPGAGTIVMHMTAKRGGACTPQDITPPVQGAK